jgi:DNA-binding transcriptional MerR regulator
MRINEVVESYGLSSRTLRYYEERGLLWSYRPDGKGQRYYEEAALERLKQIIVLRKLQIPIKDMITIFNSENTKTLIQAFVDKLESLDTEISALDELRKLVDDFLHKMLLSGIKKISAITLLYEETEKRLVNIDSNEIEPEELTFEQMSEISRKALRLHDVRIIRLPAMRVLTSQLQTGEIVELDMDNMQNMFASYNFNPIPGMRNCFMHPRESQSEEWIMMISIPESYNNETIYKDKIFGGGLYAVATSFFEDLDVSTNLLKEWIEDSQEFGLDYDRSEMIEEIMPWDLVGVTNKFQQDIFIPIKLKSK